jgi:hypothetical protein
MPCTYNKLISQIKQNYKWQLLLKKFNIAAFLKLNSNPLIKQKVNVNYLIKMLKLNKSRVK